MSILKHTQEIILRDLVAMKEEISLTESDLLWKKEPGILNSVGTLCYHICGNLRHFIGATLGHDGYIRNRDAEFECHNFTHEQLIHEIEQTIIALEHAFSKIEENDLEKEMPDTPPHHRGKSIGFFLIQLCCHFSRHRGQLDYLRRISSERKKSTII